MNPQNKEIIKKFREKYVINHPPTPPYITDEFEVDSIESFILFILEQKDQEKEKALEEYKKELREKVEKMRHKVNPEFETNQDFGRNQTVDEVLSLINSQCQAKNI